MIQYNPGLATDCIEKTPCSRSSSERRCSQTLNEVNYHSEPTKCTDTALHFSSAGDILCPSVSYPCIKHPWSEQAKHIFGTGFPDLSA